ncbi:MAG TPA: hypothetical protein VJ835_07100 [Fimbriimonadaceae bacterium]|nr:hypothetical protein [Fimbriimonadaceae bacterium]
MSFPIAIAICMAAIQTPAAKVDRSGEPALKSLLEWSSKQKRLAGTILRTYREGGRAVAYPDGIIQFWMDGDNTRVEFSDMWGTSCRVVVTKDKTLEDPGSDPVMIRKSGATIVESSSLLESKGTAASPWYYLRQGPQLLDKMDKDNSIKLIDDHTILWDSSLFGDLTIEFESTPQGNRPKSFAFNNIHWQTDMYKQFPEWFDEPNPTAQWKQVIIFGPFQGRNLFSLEAGRGRTSIDSTKPTPPPLN